MTPLDTARECFLDMIAHAEWTEQRDADIEPNGRMIDRTTHKLIVSERHLAILIDALGVDSKIYESTAQSIRRAMKQTEAA
jgi:hypothetical protein